MYNLYNLVLAKGQWFFAAGKVTAGLVEMAAYRWGGWLPVLRDQLRAQHSVTSMGNLYINIMYIANAHVS